MPKTGVLAAIEGVIGKQQAACRQRRTGRCSSNCALGLRVEREIAEWSGLATATKATTYANGKRKPYQRLHRFTKAVIELLQQEQLVLTRFQHPVTDTTVHTKLDFVAKHSESGAVVLLELKTGMDQYTKARRAIRLSETEDMPDTPLSRAMLQLGVGALLYERTLPEKQSTLLSLWHKCMSSAKKTSMLHLPTKSAVIVVNRRLRGAKMYHNTPLWRRRTQLVFSKIARTA